MLIHVILSVIFISTMISITVKLQLTLSVLTLFLISSTGVIIDISIILPTSITLIINNLINVPLYHLSDEANLE